MIRRITGTLDALETEPAPAALLTPPPGGVTHEILIPRALVEPLEPRVGETITLHTRQVLEGVGTGTSFVPRTLGFVELRDRAFFELFTSVKGLGIRKGLRALSLPTGDIASAIARRDAKWLKKLPEVGPRLADTIIAELHTRVGPFVLAAEATEALDAAAAGEIQPKPQTDDPPSVEAAIETLIALGETRTDARRSVERALERGNLDPASTPPERIVSAVFGH
ncbi:MAG: Holliday junction branch migration protein RuvA [Planctomycetota bacterium]